MPENQTDLSYYTDLLDSAVSNNDTDVNSALSLQYYTDLLNPPTDEPVTDYSAYREQAVREATEEIKESQDDESLYGFIPGEWLPTWVKDGYNNSIEGLAQQVITGNKVFEVGQYEKENFSTLEDVGSTVVSFLTLTDLGTMFAGGGLGGLAVRGTAQTAAREAIKAGLKTGVKKKLAGELSEEIVGKVVKQNAPRAVQLLARNGGVSREAAEQVIGTASERVTKALMKEQAVVGASGLGFYSGLSSALGQKATTDDISITQTLADTARGSALGLITAGSGSALNSHLINKLGRPAETAVEKLAHGTAVKALEVAEFGLLSSPLHGEMPKPEDFIHAAGTIGALTVARNAVGKAKILSGIDKKKLTYDEWSKAWGEEVYKGVQKGEIWTNKKGRQLEEVTFEKGLDKQGNEIDIITAKDVKTKKEIKIKGDKFIEQGFARKRKTNVPEEISNKRRSETFGKAKDKLKLKLPEITDLINKIRAQAGKDPVKPKKGHTGYGSLTEIERIKLLDTIRKMETVESTFTEFRKAGATNLEIPESTFFSHHVFEAFKQAKNRAKSAPAVEIVKGIDKSDIISATLTGTYLQGLKDAGFTKRLFLPRKLGLWAIKGVPETARSSKFEYSLDILKKKPKRLKDEVLTLKSEAEAKEYFKNLGERMEMPEHRGDKDVKRMRKLLTDSYNRAKKAGVNVANFREDYFPYMIKSKKMQNLYRDIMTIKAKDDVFESMKLSDLGGSTKAFVAYYEQLKSQNKLSEDTIKAMEHLKEKYIRDNKMKPDEALANAFMNLRYEVDKVYTTVGNLEKPRKADLPSNFYERDARFVLTKYLSDVAKRTGFAEVFGAKGELFETTMSALKKMQVEAQNKGDFTLSKNIGKEIQFIDKIYKQGFNLIETSAKYNWNSPFARKAWKNAVDFEVGTKIGLGYATIPNVTQTLISTAVKAGYWNTFKGGVKLALDKEYKKDVGKSGISSLSVFQMLYGLEPSDSLMGRFAMFTTKWSGFQGMNKVNQYLAAASGREYIDKLIRVRDRSINIPGRKRWAEKSLRDLGLDQNIKKISKKAPEEVLGAMYKFSRDAQLQRNVLNDPVFANDPRFRPFVLFKRFGYKQFNWIRENMAQELGRGNVVPLLRLGVGGMFGAHFVTWSKKALNNILAGEEVYDESRLFIPGLEPGTPMGTLGSDVNTDMSQYTWGDFFDHVSSVGAFGFISDIIASESKLRAVEFLVKPAIFQDTMKGIDALVNIYKDIEDYGMGFGSRLPKYIAPVLGTMPRRASKRLETKGQRETYTRYRRGIIRGRILDAMIAGNRNEARRMINAWNRANPKIKDKFYPEDYGVSAIFERRLKKREKRAKP